MVFLVCVLGGFVDLAGGATGGREGVDAVEESGACEAAGDAGDEMGVGCVGGIWEGGAGGSSGLEPPLGEAGGSDCAGGARRGARERAGGGKHFGCGCDCSFAE